MTYLPPILAVRAFLFYLLTNFDYTILEALCFKLNSQNLLIFMPFYQSFPVSPLPLLCPSQPSLWQPLLYSLFWGVWLFSFFFFLFLDYICKWYHQYLSFYVWLISVNTMPLGSIHVVTNSRIFFFLVAE